MGHKTHGFDGIDKKKKSEDTISPLEPEKIHTS